MRHFFPASTLFIFYFFRLLLRVLRNCNNVGMLFGQGSHGYGDQLVALCVFVYVFIYFCKGLDLCVCVCIFSHLPSVASRMSFSCVPYIVICEWIPGNGYFG